MYPLEVARTRLQLRSPATDPDALRRRSGGALRAMWRVARADGILALYRGLGVLQLALPFTHVLRLAANDTIKTGFGLGDLVARSVVVVRVLE